MKKITQYIPLRMSVLLVLGVLIGYHLYFPKKTLIAGLIINCALVFLSYLFTRKKFVYRWIFQYLSYVLVLLIGITRIVSEDISQQKTHYSHAITQENNLVFQVEKILKPNKYYDKYFGKIIEIDWTKAKGRVLINIKKDSLVSNLKLGSSYFTKTKLTTINKPLNPYTFDYNNYLKKQGVFHQISLEPTSFKPLSFQRNGPKIIAAQLRTKIQESLSEHAFKKNELGIINALVLGQRQSISKDLRESYAGAGAIHILAVSGLHVGILFLILSFLLKPLEKIPYGTQIKTCCIVLFLWSFALLTGLSGSVVRAVSMFTFIAIGMSIKNQKSGVLQALITSFFILVLIHPRFIFDVGFQMSYTAVLGIVLLFPKINAFIPRIKFFLLRKVWDLFCVSLSATIGTLPISLYYFHQFPGLFFISNIVIVPFLGLIMGLGILVVLLSLLGVLPEFIIQFYGSILSTMNQFIAWIAHQEQFLIKDISFSMVALIGSYLVIVMLYSWLLNKKTYRLQRLLIAVLILQSIFLFEKQQNLKGDELVIFHKTKESIIGVKNAHKLQIFHSFDSTNKTDVTFLKNYKVANRLKEINYENEFPNILCYKKHNILILDSLGIYQNISFKPNTILLRQSPKINLNRLIELHKPDLIIADGSNYKSYIKKWRSTCIENSTKLHYTGSNGAYLTKLDD